MWHTFVVYRGCGIPQACGIPRLWYTMGIRLQDYSKTMVYHGIPWQGIPVVYLGFGGGPWYTTSLSHAHFEILYFFRQMQKNTTVVYHKGCWINATPILKVRQPEREVGWGGVGAWCVVRVLGVWWVEGCGLCGVLGDLEIPSACLGTSDPAPQHNLL